MKLLYFLQELKDTPLGYDFRLFTYGPFDSEVLSDVATASSLQMLVERTVIFHRGYGYEITLGPRADQTIRDLTTTEPDFATTISEIVDELGTFGAAELELRSTILFVDREFSSERRNVNVDDLAERIRHIKPHFDKSSILDRVTEMARKRWLESVHVEN